MPSTQDAPFAHVWLTQLSMSRRSHTGLIKTANSGELRNGALRIWRGGVCFSRSFTCRKNILDLIYTIHKDSFYNIINVLFLSRDLSHPFLSFYFNQNLHHFVNNLCNLMYFLSMTVGTRFVELIGAFFIYVRFANHNVFC